jgi:uncharacterized protein (DUF302 family)
LQANLDVGLLLPCHVTVYEEDGTTTHVPAIDPLQTVAGLGDPALAAIAKEVSEKLARALEGLERQTCRCHEPLGAFGGSYLEP